MVKRAIRSAIDRAMHGRLYDFVKNSSAGLRARIPEMSDIDEAILMRVRPFTMTSPERIWACIQAARYTSARKLPGDFVECGVWRGGSSMAAALVYLEQADSTRTLWLFDTFEGMTKPIAADVAAGSDTAAAVKWEQLKTSDHASDWCAAGIGEVERNLASTKYPADRIKLIKGPVEETLRVPEHLPEEISFLRLDTDWYESTKVELEVLFDRLVPGGVLILDDYGHWAGAKKAVDEYFAERGLSYLLNRIDRTGRMLVKA